VILHVWHKLLFVYFQFIMERDLSEIEVKFLAMRNAPCLGGNALRRDFNLACSCQTDGKDDIKVKIAVSF
jgi:hypothetical protein